MKVIREYLSATGQTQAAFAMKAGINPMQLNHWLHKRRTPSLANLRKLAEATGMSLERLTSGIK